MDDVIHTLPREFTLAHIRAFEPVLAREYSQNRNIEAKIRQTLQVLRDQGVLRFLGGGRYQRLDGAPEMSLSFDPSLAAGYASRSQMARVMIETWAELNLYCLACPSDRLLKLPDNTPLSDFSCPRCTREYQLKAKNGRFAGVVPGAEYRTMMSAIREDRMPEFVLAEYDTRWSSLAWVRALPGSMIDSQRVVARKPLGETARRRGWIGCNINVEGLPCVDIIAPNPTDRRTARASWRAIDAEPGRL